MKNKNDSWGQLITEFIKTAKETPPKKPKAKKYYDKYLILLEEFGDKDWKRFFKLIDSNISTSVTNKLIKLDKAVADAKPDVKAYNLLIQARIADMKWYKRFIPQLKMIIWWILGLPIIGKLIEILFEGNNGNTHGVTPGPNNNFSDYLILGLLGAILGIITNQIFFKKN